MGEIDDRTVAGLKVTPARAFEQGITGPDAVLETVQHHDYGVEEARYGRRSGDQLLNSGTYLSDFRRQPDCAGRWSIDMWNSDAG